MMIQCLLFGGNKLTSWSRMWAGYFVIQHIMGGDMGFGIVVYLYCDGQYEECENPGAEASDGDSRYSTIKAYKADMKKFGWHFKNRKAYCPSCWQLLHK